MGCAKAGRSSDEYVGKADDGAELRVQVRIEGASKIVLLIRRYVSDLLDGSLVVSPEGCEIFSPESWSCLQSSSSSYSYSLDAGTLKMSSRKGPVGKEEYREYILKRGAR